ncbi:hypothetical protein [Thiorhodococcus drewsii]|uniref:hypothetical protein n=1 Tax=Thiorhodococcus drewsii TaxID=210408 RepID=UPI0002DA1564|nr:hypothetical protein [Thiorhodococcus drewsii]
MQGTSDEAKGLLAHVQRDLDAHHSTDLFHVQHAISQAMSLSLACAQQQAETDEAKAKTPGRARINARFDMMLRHPVSQSP